MAASTQEQHRTRSVPLPDHVCGLWLARYSNICGTSCQSQHGFPRTKDYTPYIATKWIVLVKFIEPNWTEHWATADLAADARNARKVNIYAGQGAYRKWGFIQCAEMNYCANTSDEFCTQVTYINTYIHTMPHIAVYIHITLQFNDTRTAHLSRKEKEKKR